MPSSSIYHTQNMRPLSDPGAPWAVSSPVTAASPRSATAPRTAASQGGGPVPPGDDRSLPRSLVFRTPCSRTLADTCLCILFVPTNSSLFLMNLNFLFFIFYLLFIKKMKQWASCDLPTYLLGECCHLCRRSLLALFVRSVCWVKVLIVMCMTGRGGNQRLCGVLFFVFVVVWFSFGFFLICFRLSYFLVVQKQ